ncbi:MAG TPA: hypothetical protein VN913_00430 [Candidatus Binatus sp.]|nr:hypothetical protein [Candidatus Binatus sp.]
MRGVLVLGALFFAAFALARGNPNAGIFLFLAVVCVGVAIAFAFATGLGRFGGSIRSGQGLLERDLLLGGLLLIGLLTPWSVAIPTLHWSRMFGWQSPLALVVTGAVVLTRIRSFRRYAIPAVTIAGLGLLAWPGWAGAQLLAPAFRASGFPFLPIDLLGEGWYISLLAFAIAVDGIAADASQDERAARPSEVWPFAIVPGAGLIRMHYFGRGRLWMAAAAFAVFLLQADAISPAEFQFYGALGSLPPPQPRGAALIPFALGVLVWLASLWDTRQKLLLEQAADESLERPFGARGSTAL